MKTSKKVSLAGGVLLTVLFIGVDFSVAQPVVSSAEREALRREMREHERDRRRTNPPPVRRRPPQSPGAVIHPRRPRPVGRVIAHPSVRAHRRHDAEARELMREALREDRCERISDVVTRLSNRLLSIMAQERGGNFGRSFVRNRDFWESMLDRLSEALKSCDVDCFESGEAIGQISAMGYCAASVEIGGLNGGGFLAQNSVPLCETAVFAGCQRGYQQGAREFPGCSVYMSGEFEETFAENLSQDCHVD